MRSPAVRSTLSSLQPLSIRYGLEALATRIFLGPAMDDTELNDLAGTAQRMMASEDCAVAADLGFFLIAWVAERITSHRIAAGDMGIDEAEARLLELRRQAGWQQAATEYQMLVDEIYMDTLGDFREFTLVVLFAGQRETFRQRFANGQRLLAELLPALATNDDEGNDDGDYALTG